MTDSKALCLYEEIMLLALRNKEGTALNEYLEYAVAGAVLAELLLDRRITVNDTRKQLVDIQNTSPTGDPIIDECMEKMKASKKRASLQTWVSRLAGIKKLRHKVARQLCNRRILRADEDKILYIFKRKIYPEINPIPEEKIIERLRTAIFGDSYKVEPRTAVLISLAFSVDLLSKNLGRKEIKSRKKRIQQIVDGEMTGQAAREAIQACEAALAVAIIIPAVIASTSN